MHALVVGATGQTGKHIVGELALSAIAKHLY